MSIDIPQADPGASYREQRQDIDAAMARVLESGRYILGRETEAFEREFAAAMGSAEAVAVGNGTDAIVLALRALGVNPGDLVATVAHTAVATVAGIVSSGARPMLIDIDPVLYTMDPVALERGLETARTSNQRAPVVLPVHLYGLPADMTAIGAVAARYGALILEDCAQAHGASFAGQAVGSMGAAGVFSFYPTKNLGAFGDGGAITAQDKSLAADLRALRQYGWRDQRRVSEAVGFNSRLDEIQAAVLRVKLGSLSSANARRRAIAARYDAAFAGQSIRTPAHDARAVHVYHQYVIRSDRRDALKNELEQAGVGTAIHYTPPAHQHPGYAEKATIGPAGLRETERAAMEVLSLPMFPQLTDDQVTRVIDAVVRASDRRPA